MGSDLPAGAGPSLRAELALSFCGARAARYGFSELLPQGRCGRHLPPGNSCVFHSSAQLRRQPGEASPVQPVQALVPCPLASVPSDLPFLLPLVPPFPSAQKQKRAKAKKAEDPRAAALRAALAKHGARKKGGGGSGGRGLFVVPQAFGRDAKGPDALQALRAKLAAAS